MTRIKRFVDANVLDEAKRRIHHIYDLHDTVVVAFSGGKDSLATLHLTWEVAQERGLDHVDAIFRDEELIPDAVVEFVAAQRELPWLRLRWFAVPLESHKYVLGETRRYVQWDPAREHLRPKPAWAITNADLGLPDGRVLSQYDMDAVTAQPFKGRVAILNGIRANESLMRWSSCVVKLNENYINASSTAKASLCKPIFDWAENDVFRYFYDRGIRYCPQYDAQAWAGMELRVSTPVHAESAKYIGKLRQVSPVFYQQVMDLFPEMLVQERYYRELRRGGEDLAAYRDDGFDGVARWISENITDPAQLALARQRLAAVRVGESGRPYSYPVDYVLSQFVRGAHKRRIPPCNPNRRSKWARQQIAAAQRVAEPEGAAAS